MNPGERIRTMKRDPKGLLLPDPKSYYLTPEYEAYSNARQRCNCPTNPYFKNYGARGIKFLFASFPEFIEHIGPRPSRRHSLDRIDTFGSYEPGNVRWATRSQQNKNMRSKQSKSGLRGVYPIGRKWGVKVNGVWIGTFASREEAANEYNENAKRLIPGISESLLNRIQLV